MIYKKRIQVISEDFKRDLIKAFEDEFVDSKGVLKTLIWKDMKWFFKEWLEPQEEEEQSTDEDKADFTGADDLLGYANDR